MHLSSGLNKLSLANNRIGEDRIAYGGDLICGRIIGKALRNSRIEELDLSFNNLRYCGARYIGEALRTNTRLRVLRLSSIWAEAFGAASLAKGLKENSTLRELNLSDNGIGASRGFMGQKGTQFDSGAERIADALRENRTLEQLILFNNGMQLRCC